MRIIAVANPKGGSAKTTTTVNLAGALAELGRTVLVVDLDPQGSATRWLAVHGATREKLNVNFLAWNVHLSQLIQASDIEGVCIIPSATDLVRSDQLLREPKDAIDSLGRRLRQLQHWDYILIDCPASLGVLTQLALAVSDEILAPVEASILGLLSLINLYKTIEFAKRAGGACGPVQVLPCRVDMRTRHAREVVEKLRCKYEGFVFNNVIHENVRLTECPGFRQAIIQYAPTSVGARDYLNVAGELIEGEGNLDYEQAANAYGHR